jgi:hypothetical protein
MLTPASKLLQRYRSKLIKLLFIIALLSALLLNILLVLEFLLKNYKQTLLNSKSINYVDIADR